MQPRNSRMYVCMCAGPARKQHRLQPRDAIKHASCIAYGSMAQHTHTAGLPENVRCVCVWGGGLCVCVRMACVYGSGVQTTTECRGGGATCATWQASAPHRLHTGIRGWSKIAWDQRAIITSHHTTPSEPTGPEVHGAVQCRALSGRPMNALAAAQHVPRVCVAHAGRRCGRRTGKRAAPWHGPMGQPPESSGGPIIIIIRSSSGRRVTYSFPARKLGAGAHSPWGQRKGGESGTMTAL